VLVPDHGVGVQRVAVGVEPGERDASGLEEAEVVVARVLTVDHVVDGDVDRGEEPACVDLSGIEPEGGDDVEGLLEGSVVEDRGVDAELHGRTVLFWVVGTSVLGTAVVAPPEAAEAATDARISMLCSPSSKLAQRGSDCSSGSPATSSRNARA
jgi:hypothetical protein